MKIKGSDVFRHLLLACLTIIWLTPIVWLVATSFSKYTGMNTSTFFPTEWGLTSYKELLFDSDSVTQFPSWFKNTFLIAAANCVISTSFVLMVSYATSCMRFKMRKTLMNIGITLNLFPSVLSMIAVYFILKSLNLTNNHFGLLLVYSASSGLGYLIAKGFMDTIPVSLREAAYIDGASEARVFFKIVIPMSRPIIVYTIISSFLVPWMDFVLATLMMNSGISSQWTVALGLNNMLDRMLLNTHFSMFCAGGVLVSIPISILFVIMQKFYIEGVTGGAVKG